MAATIEPLPAAVVEAVLQAAAAVKALLPHAAHGAPLHKQDRWKAAGTRAKGFALLAVLQEYLAVHDALLTLATGKGNGKARGQQ